MSMYSIPSPIGVPLMLYAMLSQSKLARELKGAAATGAVLLAAGIAAVAFSNRAPQQAAAAPTATQAAAPAEGKKTNWVHIAGGAIAGGLLVSALVAGYAINQMKGYVL